MDEEHRAKATEIRALALNFLDLAEITVLEDYKAKLLQTAARLTDAANALDEVAQSSLRLIATGRTGHPTELCR